MKRHLFTLLIISCLSMKSFAQIITFQPTVTGTGFLPPNNSSGGISWVIDNTNPFPAQFQSMTYYSSATATRDYQLWWAPTSVTMPIAFPPSGVGGWTNIAAVTGVNMIGGNQTTVFSGLTFNIPANTALRFYLTSTNVEYKGVGTPPSPPPGIPSGVSPTTFTLSGVNLLLAEAQYAGNNVGWGGGNFSPRAFLGAITLNLLGPPCVGQPVAGLATAMPNNPCPGTNVTLSLTGGTAASAIAYQWQRASSPTAPPGGWFTIPGATNATSLYMPPPGSITYYRCVVVCTPSGLNDTSNVTGAVVVQPWSVSSPCYCTNVVTSPTGNDIGQVTLGSFVNPTGPPPAQTSNPSANGQVTNFTTITPSPSYTQGQTYPVTVQQITSTTVLTNSWVKVWIDFNHNTSFSDPGEEVFSSSSNALNLFSPSGSILIPPTSTPGCTRMRVKLQTTGSATITTPCNTIATGEVEEYIICINPAGPYDPTISSMVAPTSTLCTDSFETVSATVCNYGSNPVVLSTNPYYVTFTVTGPLGVQTFMDTLDTGTLPAFGAVCSTVVFNNVNMFAGGNYSINAYVTCPTLTNAFVGNDSLVSPITIYNYRPSAGTPYNLCQFDIVPFGQGLTVGGCSAPIQDSVEIVFNLTACIDNVGAVTTGTTLGPGNANCNNAYAGNFGNAPLPTLPTGANFIQNAILTVSHLASGFPTEMRFNLYSGSPVPPTLYAGCTPGYPAPVQDIVQTGLVTTALTNILYTRHITPPQLSAMFNPPAPTTINLGYFESFNDFVATSDITSLNSGGTTVAKLKIYYQYVPPAFAWYDVPSGGASLYSLSPFNPLSVTNAVVNNSNVPGNYTFYAACLGLPNCRVPVNLIINPTPSACQDTLFACEFAPSANNGIFVLDSSIVKNSVSCFNPLTSVLFYGDQALLGLIPYPHNDTASNSFIYSKVFYPATGCYSSDSVKLEVSSIPQFTLPFYTGFACAPNAIDISSLISIFAPTPIDTFHYSNAAYTVLHPNPHAIFTADTLYMIAKTNNGLGCADTATAFIDILPATNNIANQNTTGNYSVPGSVPCGVISLTDGNTETLFTTSDCRKVVMIKDSTDLISLGDVTICEEIFNGVPTHTGSGSNPQPYVNRSYEITPTNNGKAIVCLYYLDQDFADYSAAAVPSGWPVMNPTSNLSITQVDNGDLNTPGHIAKAIPNSSITTTYDAATTVWQVCFPVDSFSYFYAHTSNPNNTPLPVSLLSFTGKGVQGTTELEWITANELNNSHFVVERSMDGKQFTAVSEKIATKAFNGNSQSQLSYAFTDLAPLKGHNHYRLLQADIDGHASYSRTIDVYFGNEEMVTLYPNPVYTLLNVNIHTQKATKAYVKISDATGKTIRMVELSLQAGDNASKIDLESLVDGMYMVNITNNKGLNFSQAIRKK